MTTLIVLAGLAAALAASGCAAAWLLPAGPGRDAGVVALLVGTAVLCLVAAVPGPVASEGDDLAWLLPVVLAPVGVLGGGPVTALVLRLVDRGEPGSSGPGQVEQAAAVLRGGAWIGVFERAGIVASLLGGWPEGIAVVLGLKGLGRYSELKGGDQPSGAGGGVAERFIIGTFSSVLWAAAAAGALVGLVGPG
jgi:hypothetical protein